MLVKNLNELSVFKKRIFCAISNSAKSLVFDGEKVSCLDKDEKESQHLYTSPSVCYQKNKDVPFGTKASNHCIFNNCFSHMGDHVKGRSKTGLKVLYAYE